MTAIEYSLHRVPAWYYIIVLLVIAINAVYLYYKIHVPCDKVDYEQVNGNWVVVNNHQNNAQLNAGLRPGDIVLAVNSKPFERWLDNPDGKKAGDQAEYLVLRNGKEIRIQVTLGLLYSNFVIFFWMVFLFLLVLSLTSLYMLAKKPHDHAVILFFIYLQLISLCMNAWNIPFTELPAIAANTTFAIGNAFMGPVLIHFHLLFPKPVTSDRSLTWFLVPLYLMGLLTFLFISYFKDLLIIQNLQELLAIDRIDLKWLTLTFLLAMAVALYQFFRMKDTLSRNQLLIVIIGSFFGLITPVFYTFFYDFVNQLGDELYTIIIPHGVGSIIMICCILIAIFRYRIWDIEVFIRKALLYLGATAIIILTYLFLIWIVDRLIISENNFVRFVILGVSVIVFLALRDSLQYLIDRLFHRETYDSATVVSDFEAKLAGIYRFDELKEKIVNGLDDIFHFKSFVFSLKKENLVYEPACVYGINDPELPPDFSITSETEEKLRKSKVFSPDELNQKPPVLDLIKGDLIVPMVSEGETKGFFICGQKRSERIYSRQDINVLMLLARRVIALLHTANLYQKDLDRQLMLERERARISQDMHDDIGAGLTKIAMISEAPEIVLSPQSAVCSPQSLTADCRLPTADSSMGIDEPKLRLNKIATSSREMISRLNVIVWALNPKYDNLESLISYLRPYFSEYIENFGIAFMTDIPDEVPDISITPDTRRNIFYAVQEAIHNAVKHSGCSGIRLSIALTPSLPRSQGRGGWGVRFSITDNGKGFDQVKQGSGGNGLLNMKKRAEELDGTCEIRSEQGQGTSIVFAISLK